jgi:hypothetical protein
MILRWTLALGVRQDATEWSNRQVMLLRSCGNAEVHGDNIGLGALEG